MFQRNFLLLNDSTTFKIFNKNNKPKILVTRAFFASESFTKKYLSMSCHVTAAAELRQLERELEQ